MCCSKVILTSHINNINYSWLMRSQTLTSDDLQRVPGAERWDALVEVLRKSTTLRQIRLSKKRKNLMDESFTYALAINQTLQSLALINIEIDDRGARRFENALKANKSLKSLELNNNAIGIDGARSLAAALKDNQSITSLEIRNNQIADDGAKSLADALKVNRSLETLRLVSNSIGIKGIESLADALKSNKTITSLAIWNNKFGDEGAQSLAAAIKVNTSISQLRFDNNDFGDDGVKSLADALKFNKTIKEIFLDHNPFGDEGVKSLAAVILQNKSLMKIFLWNEIQIGADGLHALADAKTKCSKESRILQISLNRKNIEEEDAKALTSWMGFIRKSFQREIDSKDREIASLNAAVDAAAGRGPDIVDLTKEDETEPTAKRPCTNTAGKSNLAIMHEHNQKLVQVKQEKTVIEENLRTAKGDLQDTREDLEDANELVVQQTLFTDIWQSKFDELAALVADKVDGATLAAIRNRKFSEHQH
jgi:Ran GTPase-activating protein (RanGAP) involved in mRNA processing and transport